MFRACAECGELFVSTSGSGRYCGPRCKDLYIRGFPCARCGEKMRRSSTSKPGVSACLECRRKRPDPRISPCVDCGRTARGIRCRSCRGVQQRHGSTPEEIRAQRYALQRIRVARDRQAPGLTITQRKHLRAKWIKQRQPCAYCPALAEQVDHVIPLALGGTNYIGNLVPACAACNRAKSDSLLIAWRNGKKARRMRWGQVTGHVKTAA